MAVEFGRKLLTKRVTGGSVAPKHRRKRGDNMNKAQLIEYVAKQTKMTKRSTETAVNATLEGIKKNVKKGGVQLVGFGSFTVVSRKGRMGRNPQTGAPMKIKPSKSVKFRPGKDFKGML